MNVTTTEKIEVTLTTTNHCFREHCVTCGGGTEKDGTYAMWSYPKSETGTTYVMCVECLAAGPDGIADRIIAQAVRAEENARELRRVAQEFTWVIPTVADWQTAMHAADAELQAEIDAAGEEGEA